MMNKREEFLGTAAEMFPTKTEFTRSELVEVANKLGMKYAPSWIVKSDEFKLGNGLYSLVSSPVAVMRCSSCSTNCRGCFDANSKENYFGC